MTAFHKAIIPAAGLGKRMRPLSSYIPKPMLPLGKKPVLHHIVDEIRAAGVKEILIPTRSDHEEIGEYFQDDGNITIKIDDSAGGPGEAVLTGEEFVDGSPFLVIFSDAPLAGEKTEKVIQGMSEIFQKNSPDAVMSIYPVPKKEAGSRGIVKLADQKTNGLFEVETIIEKPDSISISEPMASTCRYLFTPDLFDALKNAERDEDGELQLTAGVNELLRKGGTVLATSLPKGLKRHDTGNFDGYAKAQAAFGQYK